MDATEKASLLIIEDHEIVALGLKTLIGSHPALHSIQCVSTAKEAIQLTVQHPYDLYVIDVELPDMNGIELIKNLKLLSPDSAFIFHTIHDELWTLFWSGSLCGDSRWWFVPLLLSGGSYDADGSDSLVVLFAGLAGWNRDGGELDMSWLLPLWYREGDNLFTLPYAHWKSGDGTEHSWYTPFFGTLRGTHSGSWLFPLWDWDDGPDGDYDHSFLVIAGASHNKWNGTTRYLFPLWRRQTDGDDPAVPWRGPAWQASGSTETRWFLGLAGATHSVSRRPDELWFPGILVGGKEADGSEAQTNAAPSVEYIERESSWFFPLWDAETTRGAVFDPATGARVSEGSLEEFSLLWFLYDSRREHASDDGHEYARRRVLWRLYHDETLDGDRSIDVFPGIGIDSRKDGYRKYSFLWRLFRYERDPAKGTSLDILFLPLRRP